MKYQIIIEKTNDNLYLAYCQKIMHIRAEGPTLHLALSNLKENMLCYLHDYAPELEVVMADPRNKKEEKQ
jgi:predicted RNase H-like HicB family nuclease